MFPVTKYYLQNLPRIHEYKLRTDLEKVIDNVINLYAKRIIESAKEGDVDCYYCDFFTYVEIYFKYEQKQNLDKYFSNDDLKFKFISKFPGCLVKKVEQGFLIDWS